MTNWWRFLADWNTNSNNIGLYQNNQEVNQSCTQAINSSLSVTAVCSGGSFSVNYFGNGVIFNSGNVLSVQLSDATGSFTNPVNIGTLNSTSANGSINVTVPTNASSGNSYLVRVNSSNPAIIGSGLSLLIIKSLPLTPTITSGSSITFCTGNSVNLTSNAASGNQWYKDGIAINSATNNTLNATSSGSYTVKVTLSGCESVSSNAIAVTVNAFPSTPTITAGTVTTFCSGGSVTLTSNAANGNQWYKDGVAISGSTGTTLNATAGGSYTAKVILNGCESAASNSIVVIVNPIPATPTITAGTTTTFCTGGSVTLTSNAASGNQWYKDGIAISGSTGSTLNVTASGSYTVKVILNSCESAASNSIPVTVNAIPPKPTVNRNGADMVSSSATGNQWYADGVAVSGATSSTYRPSASSQISVQVTINGCISPMSDNYYYLITGITDPTALENTINVFPNPVTNKLHIVSQYRNPVHIQLLDIAGRSFAEINNVSGTLELDMSRYTAGCYLMVIKDSRSLKSFRKLLVKQY